MHLDKHPDKNQNTENPLQRYKYSSKNAISSFKQAKCCKVFPLENFKILNEIAFSYSASLPTGIDLAPIPLGI